MKLPITIISFVAMVSLLLACGEEPPPSSPPKVVSKKITMQPATGPTESASQSKTDEAAPASKSDESEKTQPKAEPVASDLVQASLEVASTYDPKGRFDPFEPLFKEQPEAPVVTDVKGKQHERRIPQTPLERVALSQLKLSAIIRAPSGDRALVEDATGKGYVVTNGTYIGLNSGKVIQITKDRIVIEEEIENVLGELKIQNTELKLQKPAGEL
jgi:type IV pilus assembly protein PilP